MKAEPTIFRGQAVLLVTLTPQASGQFHALPLQEQRRRLAAAGLDMSVTYYQTCDSDGNVYLYQPTN